jgi:zinc transporter ZupT
MSAFLSFWYLLIILSTTYRKYWLGLSNSFAAGVFLSTGLLHMLPEAIEGLGKHSLSVASDDFPLALLLSLVGFTIVFFAERVVIRGGHDGLVVAAAPKESTSSGSPSRTAAHTISPTALRAYTPRSRERAVLGPPGSFFEVDTCCDVDSCCESEDDKSECDDADSEPRSFDASGTTVNGTDGTDGTDSTGPPNGYGTLSTIDAILAIDQDIQPEEFKSHSIGVQKTDSHSHSHGHSHGHSHEHSSGPHNSVMHTHSSLFDRLLSYLSNSDRKNSHSEPPHTMQPSEGSQTNSRNASTPLLAGSPSTVATIAAPQIPHYKIAHPISSIENDSASASGLRVRVRYYSRLYEAGLRAGLDIANVLGHEQNTDDSDTCVVPIAEIHEPKFNPVPYVILVVLSIHALLAGFAVGADDEDQQAAILLGALSIHKFTAAVSLAIVFIKANLSRWRSLQMTMAFSLSTPIGIGAGMALLSAGSSESILPSVFMAIGSGTFLYIGTLETLVDEFVESHAHRYQKFAAYFVGAATMSVLAAFD